MNEIEKFGKLMNQRARQVAGAYKDAPPELGVINGDWSLSVSSLSNTIPKGEYMVTLHLKTENTNENLTITATDGAHSHVQSSSQVEGDHSHVVLVGETIRGIQPGDRVLVVWVGTEPIVVDIVVDS